MSRIKSKDTTPEIKFRNKLFLLGYRYRLHAKELPGNPDIILRKYKIAIFVHGCFWHRHEGCKNSTTPKSNQQFWDAKFKKNMARDAKALEDLEKMEWMTIVIWECNIKEEKGLQNTLKEVTKRIEKRKRQAS